MTPSAIEEAIAHALDGLVNNRLVLLAGAGLSMAPPSCLPGAADIAANAKREYDARYHGIRPPLSPKIEEQADFFFQQGELGVYLNEYIDPDAFAGRPNPGHLAVADLLLSNAFQTVITTNVDILVEGAALHLFGHAFPAIDGNEAAAVPVGTAPLLKIHGCWNQDRNNTVWTAAQLAEPPVQGRVQSSAAWLSTALIDKDLIVLGYSTDWDYLNEVLAQTLGAVSPSSVIVVNSAPFAHFQANAAELAALADRAEKGSFYVEVSGSDFLRLLRLEASRMFVRRAIAQGAHEFEVINGNPPDPASLEAPAGDNDSLWSMRRDLLGCKPNKPARRSVPHDEPAVGLTILQIRSAGGTPVGAYWAIGGRKVRLLRAANTFLHEVEADYREDMPPITAPDVVVAIGAEDIFLPADLVRNPDGSIARGAGPAWMTRALFEATL